MEKQESKRVTEFIVIAVVIVCFGLVIFQLETNIQNTIGIHF